MTQERVHQYTSVGLLTLIWYSTFYAAPNIMSGVEISLDPSQGGSGNALTQLFYVILFLIVASLLLVGGQSSSIKRFPRSMLATLLWCWLSIVWAVDAGISFRRLVFSTLVVLTVVCIVEVLSYDRLMRLLVLAFGVIIIADFLAVLLMPLARVDSLNPPGWRGLHPDKNEAGSICAGCLIFFVHETARTRSRVVGPCLCAASAVFLLETHSKTSIGFTGLAVLAGFICRWAYISIAMRCVALAGLFIVTIAVGSDFQNIIGYLTGVLDDPGAFTGRSQIWSLLIDYAQDHFLLGAGYGSFWAVGDASPMLLYGAGWLANVYEAHNGYLDLLVNVGFIGLVIAAFDLIIWPLAAVSTTSLPDGVSRSLLCALLVFTWLHNLLESTFLNRATPAWIIAVIAYSVLSKSATEGSRVASTPSSHEIAEDKSFYLRSKISPR